MSNKRILTFQDISCVGQCSITIALPVLSAMGIETCILPSMILSTHTGGFKNVVKRDFADTLPEICKSWQDNNITFDALYTGYLGNRKHIETVEFIKNNLLKEGAPVIIDPVMGDHGKLYSGFDEDYVNATRELCSHADIILPNLTEACLLAKFPYREDLTEQDYFFILMKCAHLGPKTVILTGVSDDPKYTGACVYKDGSIFYARAKKYPGSFAGTGDLFASVFTGTYLKTDEIFKSAQAAADYVSNTIGETIKNPTNDYGVRFELLLKTLVD